MDEFMESFVKFKSPISRLADLKITYELSSVLRLYIVILLDL